MRVYLGPLLASVLGMSTAAAATHSVCPSGCDFPSPAACAIGDHDGDGIGDGTRIAAGDVCEVQGGTYHETVSYQNTPFIGPSGLQFVCSTPPCVIDGDSVRANGFLAYAGWSVDGFEIRNTLDSAIIGGAGKLLGSIRNSVIRDAGGRGISGLAVGAVVENNLVLNTWSYGIFCGTSASSANVTVRNNLILDAAINGGHGINCTTSGSVVEHNTVDVRDAFPVYGIFAASARYNLVLGGNTSISASVALEANLVDGGNADYAGAAAPGTGNLIGDPGLVHPRDPHLTGTSQAIDAAVGSSEALDLEGRARDSAPDIGAFEYDAAHIADPLWAALESISVQTDVASPDAVVTADGPLVVYFDRTADTLSSAERLSDGSWRHDVIASSVTLPVSVDHRLRMIALALDGATGQGGVAWVERNGAQTVLRGAGRDPQGCSSDCTSPWWGGCGDAAIFTSNGVMSIDAAINPVTGLAGIAVAEFVNGGCGIGTADAAVYLFEQDGAGGWNQVLIEQASGCDRLLGSGISLVYHPLTGTAELFYARVPAGSTDGSLVHADNSGGSFVTTVLSLGADTHVYDGRFNLVAAAYGANGDRLGVGFSRRQGTGTYQLAFTERVVGAGWDAVSTLVDAVGTGGGRPIEGLALVYDGADRPWMAIGRNGAARLGTRDANGWRSEHFDVGRTTGAWMSVGETPGGEILVVYQDLTPDHDVRMMSRRDPGGASTQAPVQCDDADACTADVCTAGSCGNTPITCDDGDACTSDSCDAGTGCVFAANAVCGVGTYGPCEPGCSPCPEGTYGPSPNLASCLDCPSGQYQSLPGQTGCLDCSPGYTSTPGSNLCSPCEVGTYQDAGGQGACIACPVGETTLTTGSTSSSDCYRPVTAPSEPQNGQTQARGSDTVTLSVDPPADDGGAAIIGYSWAILLDDIVQDTKFVAAPTTTAMFTSLLPSTVYEVRVVALNASFTSPVHVFATTTLALPPTILSFVASDPDDADVVYSIGDAVTLTFSEATNMTGGTGAQTKAQVDAWLGFSPLAIGVDYTGQWVAADRFVVTVVTVGSAPLVGVEVAQVKPAGDLRDAAGTSAPSDAISPLLSGNWGTGTGGITVTTPSGLVGAEDAWIDLTGTTVTTGTEPLAVTVTVVTPSGCALSLDGTAAAADTPVGTSGTVAEVNASLASLRLQGPPNFHGPVVVSVEATNAATSAQKLLLVDITPSNDPPQLTVPATVSVDYGTATALGGVTISDVDEADATPDVTTLTILVPAGGAHRLRVQTPVISGVSYAPQAGTEATVLTIVGVPSLLQQVLDQGVILVPTGLDPVTVTFFARDLSGATDSDVMDASIACTAAVPAPAITSAQFNDAITSISVRYDIPLYGVASTYACDALFDTGTVGGFGPSPFCAFGSADILTVFLGAGATVLPGDTLTTLEGAPPLVCPAAPLPSMSVTLEAPTNPTVPTVTAVSGPNTIGCTAASFFASVSNTGGRAGTFSWSLSPSTDVAPAILAAIAAETGNRVTFAAGDLPGEVQYTLTATFTNFLGVTSAPTSKVFTQLAPANPTIVPLAGDSFVVQPDTSVTLGARVSDSACAGGASLAYSWTVDDPNFDLTAQTSSVLFIPAGALPVGKTYTYTFTATDTVDASRTSSHVFTVEVIASDLVAIIDGPSSLITRVGDPFTLDGSRSFDPDDVTVPPSGATYGWDCTFNGAGPCPLVLPSQAVVNLGAGELTEGTWVFTLSFARDTRTAQVSQQIVVTPCHPPMVSIVGLGAAADGRVNRAQIVRLSAGSDAANPSYLWSMDTGVLDLLSAEVAAGSASPTLSILPDVLIPGETYVFRVGVSDPAACADGAATFTIVVNRPPYGGTVSREPSAPRVDQGTAVTVTAAGWTDDGLGGLSYQLFVDAGAAGSAGPGSSVTVGDLAPGTHQLRMVISDTEGLSAQASLDIEVCAGTCEARSRSTGGGGKTGCAASTPPWLGLLGFALLGLHRRRGSRA